MLTHWGHAIIGQRQAIIWTDVGILLFGPVNVESKHNNFHVGTWVRNVVCKMVTIFFSANVFELLPQVYHS